MVVVVVLLVVLIMLMLFGLDAWESSLFPTPSGEEDSGSPDALCSTHRPADTHTRSASGAHAGYSTSSETR